MLAGMLTPDYLPPSRRLRRNLFYLKLYFRFYKEESVMFTSNSFSLGFRKARDKCIAKEVPGPSR